MEIKPLIIKKSVKRVIDAKEIIYAFKTTVPVETTKQEIESLINKFSGKGFQFTKAPNGAIFFRFIIEDQEFGVLPIHLDLPKIYLKIGSNDEMFLEKESYRLLLLDLKNRMYRLSHKARPFLVLLDRVLTRSGQTLIDVLSVKDNVAGLLPEGEKYT